MRPRTLLRLIFVTLLAILTIAGAGIGIFLRDFSRTVESIRLEQWNRDADEIAQRFEGAPDETTSRSEIEQALASTPGLVSLKTGDGDDADSAPHTRVLRRNTGRGRLLFVFDASTITNLERIADLSYGATILLAVCGALIFILSTLELPASSETPKGAAGDKALMEVFQTAIASMRGHEEQLRELHESEKRRAEDLTRITSALTRSLSSGFMAFDPEHRIIQINGAARSILELDDSTSPEGHAIDEVMENSPFAETLRGALDDRVAIQRREIAHGGTPPRTIGLTTVPLLSEHDEYLGLLALFTDLTPMKSLEERMRQIQTLADLGEVSAGIAHEFRNSLGTMLGYIRLARKRVDPDSDTARQLREAEGAGSELLAAVDGLLNFARPMAVGGAAVELDELLEGVCHRLQQLAPEVRIDLDLDTVRIDGDHDLLIRAFENLVRNAVESVIEQGAPGGGVRITARPDEYRTVTISDDGVGLDPAEADQLFIPFRSTKERGFGLGLPLARKIILLHGGDLRLEGVPGEGATVTVSFPLSPSPEEG